ncbi:MAG: sensor domain-containing protein [Gammaproteobacteria bacterium]|nr:sensor domain-containing protein [Gammaproteobacteria bacterium]MDE1888018.1 sensor domain-containing protein [Gammaproteobacteria bacterium]MDE2024551.1 sensor domain-containing protein [Gammaproteobacteria bacterium]MDE2139024.1 sensor domain-containing protein [Gammaproteobacteria bacterium]MDE2272962.1 sensor domain-containing protein [Gammaproteobacteria bacterium]
MTNAVPRSIQDYLEQLRAALSGADPALIQDALYDAEEYLRGELHGHPDQSEEQILAAIATSYGAPEEVADAYRATEAKVQAALRTPRPAKRPSVLGRFFSVLSDPRAYASLFYLLMGLFTGIFYFTWVMAGSALSFGMLPLIIGIPFFLLFLGSVRMLSLVEGRIVETLLGVRMPRRPPHPGGSVPLFTRIKELLTDGRTWSTLFYMVLQLFLGILYFTMIIAWLAVALTLILSPLSHVWHSMIYINGPVVVSWFFWPLCVIAGILLLIALLHAVRAMGYVHGHIAKRLLVRLAD